MTPSQPQAQPVNSSSPVNYWDAIDAWGRACEAKRREEWVMLAEQAERDAVYGRAEVCGGLSLMERVARPCVFLIVAGFFACAVLTVGRHFGWL